MNLENKDRKQSDADYETGDFVESQDGGRGIKPRPVQRKENTHSLQELNAQLEQLKSQISRSATSSAGKLPAQDNRALLDEIRKISDKLTERPSVQAAAIPVTPAVAVAPQPIAPKPQSDEVALALKDIDTKLVHVDAQLADLSVMTVSNDLAPVISNLATIAEAVHLLSVKLVHMDPDVLDKLLDELVRLQTAVEDVRRSFDARPLTPTNFTMPAADNAVDRQEFSDVREELSQGIHLLNGQIAAMHADLKIYAGDSLFGGERKNSDVQTQDADRLLQELIATEQKLKEISEQNSRLAEEQHNEELIELLRTVRIDLAELKVQVPTVRDDGEVEHPSYNTDAVAALGRKLDEIRNAMRLFELQMGEVANVALAGKIRIGDDDYSDAQASILPKAYESLSNQLAVVEGLSEKLTALEFSTARMKDIDIDSVLAAISALESKIVGGESTVVSAGVQDAVLAKQTYETALQAIADKLDMIGLKLESASPSVPVAAGSAASTDELKNIITDLQLSLVQSNTSDNVLEAIVVLQSKIDAVAASVVSIRSASDGAGAVGGAIETLRQDLSRVTANAGTGQIAEINEQISALRRELTSLTRAGTNVYDVSNDAMITAVQSLKRDMANASAVADVKDSIAALRRELGSLPSGSGLTTLSQDMKDGLSSLRRDINNLPIPQKAVADNGEVLDAIASLRRELGNLNMRGNYSASSNFNSNEILDAVSSLRRELNNLSGSRSYGSTDIVDSISSLRREIANLPTERFNEEQLRRIIREELSLAGRVQPTPSVVVVPTPATREVAAVDERNSAIAMPMIYGGTQSQERFIAPRIPRTTKSPVKKTPVKSSSASAKAKQAAIAAVAKKAEAKKAAIKKSTAKTTMPSKPNKTTSAKNVAPKGTVISAGQTVVAAPKETVVPTFIAAPAPIAQTVVATVASASVKATPTAVQVPAAAKKSADRFSGFRSVPEKTKPLEQKRLTKPSITKSAVKKTAAKKTTPIQKTSAKKLPAKKPTVTAAPKVERIESKNVIQSLTVADSIAHQISSKLVLEQMLRGSGKGSDRLVVQIKGNRLGDVPLDASAVSIQRYANQSVLDRMTDKILESK